MNTTARPSPYRGLTPYTEDDAPYFFGRTAEIAVITANLRVARLTLLYGPSGVGKSSVLRAGLLVELQRRARANFSAGEGVEAIPVYFDRWQINPLHGLFQTIQAAVQPYLNQPPLPLATPDRSAAAPVGSPSGRLVPHLHTWSEQTDADLLLVLDQFEEYLLYHPDEAGPGSFAHELARIVNNTALRTNVLLRLREDALARLDRFQEQIAFLFDNRLSIARLDRAAGSEAMTQPLLRYNAEHGTTYTIEPQLVQTILDQVGPDQVALSKGGAGVIAAKATTHRIEAPYLQLVLTRLWQQTVGAEATVLRQATLEALGGVDSIVSNYLNDTLASLPAPDQALAVRFFDRLVTPGGTKIALTLDELASFAKVDPTVIETVVRQLDGRRLLRSVPSPTGVMQFEIFHDMLGPPLLAWQARYQAAQEEAGRLAAEQAARAAAEQRAREAEARAALEELARSEAQARAAAEQRNNRRLRWFLGITGLLLTLAVLAGLTAYWAQQTAEAERNRALLAEGLARQSAAVAQRARDQALIRQSQLLASTAQQQLAVDPVASLHLALQGAPTAGQPRPYVAEVVPCHGCA
jgi:hypothetical protein